MTAEFHGGACTPFSAASAGKKGAMIERPSWPQKVPMTIKAKMPLPWLRVQGRGLIGGDVWV